MPDTPITPIITEISEMQTAFKQPSCNSKEPFLKYPSTGTPPTLSFNVPQNTAFVTYGHLIKYLPVEYFKAFCKNVPENNFFEMIKNMNADQLNELFGYETVTYGKWATVDKSAFTSGAAPGNVASPTDIVKSMHAGTAKIIPTAAYHSPAMSIPHIDKGALLTLPKTITKGSYGANGLRPYDIWRLNGLGRVTKYVAKPPVPVPRIIILEE